MNKLKLLPLLLAVCLIASACSGGQTQTPVDVVAVDTEQPTDTNVANGELITPSGDGMTAALSAVAYPEIIDRSANMDAYRARLAAVDAAYLASVQRFAFNTASVLMAEGSDENAIYSPASMYFALAMLSECASGNTRTELLTALGTDEATLQTNIKPLFESLYTGNATGTCQLCDSIWLSDAYTFKKSAVDALASRYYAEAFSADFYGEAYTDDISSWVSTHTGNMLGLDPAAFSVSADTAMLLFNTVFFRDEWVYKFDPALTVEDDFLCSDGSISSCELMSTDSTGPYLDTDSYTATELSLKNGSIRFILPKEGYTPYDILGDASVLTQAASGELTGYANINWKVPKLDYGVSTDMADLISDIGAPSVFDPQSADFTSLSDGGLFLSGALQQCRVSLDENGVTAAAFTELILVGAGMPEQTIEMALNKPFIYVISDGGVPLFIGVVNSAEMDY